MAEKQRVGSTYGSKDLSHKTGIYAGARDAIHVPVVLANAAMALRAGDKVFFVDGTTVHPVGSSLQVGSECSECESKDNPIEGFHSQEGIEYLLCEDCFDEDRKYHTRFPDSNAAEGLVDPWITGEVTPGDYVWIFPLPGLVKNLSHTFDLTVGVDLGTIKLVSPDDEDYLNDSCRGCYD